MRSKWEELVDKLNLKDMVEFKGYVPHREKLYYLSKCRALVLPSIFEGFGMVILEAWAFKKASNRHRRRTTKQDCRSWYKWLSYRSF